MEQRRSDELIEAVPKQAPGDAKANGMQFDARELEIELSVGCRFEKLLGDRQRTNIVFLDSYLGWFIIFDVKVILFSAA